jgi:hypothetical protein
MENGAEMIARIVTSIVVALVAGAALGFLGSVTGASFGLLPTLIGGLSGALTYYIMNNLAGTRRIPLASATERTEALKMAVPADRAAIYIMRTGFVGKAAGMTISIDGRDVAQLKSPRFTRVEVAPGSRMVGARFSGGAGAQSAPAQAAIACVAGQAVVLHLSSKMGALKNQLVIEPLIEDDARRTLERAGFVVADIPSV